MNAVAKMLRAGVRAYQVVAAGRPSPCRYQPSCSSYAIEALEVHGATRGSWLAVRRIGRCHPWGSQGLDPVPPRRSQRGEPAADPSPTTSHAPSSTSSPPEAAP